MCCRHRYPGLGLIMLGLIIVAAGAARHFAGGCCPARLECHMADVCAKSAQSVQK